MVSEHASSRITYLLQSKTLKPGPGKVDILILGAGWTSTFLIPLLKKDGITYAATTTTGRDGTYKFKFEYKENNEIGNEDGIEQYKALPDYLHYQNRLYSSHTDSYISLRHTLRPTTRKLPNINSFNWEVRGSFQFQIKNCGSRDIRTTTRQTQERLLRMNSWA